MSPRKTLSWVLSTRLPYGIELVSLGELHMWLCNIVYDGRFLAAFQSNYLGNSLRLYKDRMHHLSYRGQTLCKDTAHIY